MLQRLRRGLDQIAVAADERTRAARGRSAEALFMGERMKPADYAVTSAYFSAFSWRWARHAVDPGHLKSFGAALDALPTDFEPDFVLDVGTGAGGSAAMLADHFPRARVEAVDTSRQMLRAARRVNARPNLTFRHADVRRLPYETSSVDLVCCFNSIVAPPEIHRLLKADGLLLTASTWFPPRDEQSSWVRRFRDSGFDLVTQQPSGDGSWEIWRAT